MGTSRFGRPWHLLAAQDQVLRLDIERALAEQRRFVHHLVPQRHGPRRDPGPPAQLRAPRGEGARRGGAAQALDFCFVCARLRSPLVPLRSRPWHPRMRGHAAMRSCCSYDGTVTGIGSRRDGCRFHWLHHFVLAFGTDPTSKDSTPSDDRLLIAALWCCLGADGCRPTLPPWGAAPEAGKPMAWPGGIRASEMCAVLG